MFPPCWLPNPFVRLSLFALCEQNVLLYLIASSRLDSSVANRDKPLKYNLCCSSLTVHCSLIWPLSACWVKYDGLTWLCYNLIEPGDIHESRPTSLASTQDGLTLLMWTKAEIWLAMPTACLLHAMRYWFLWHQFSLMTCQDVFACPLAFLKMIHSVHCKNWRTNLFE